MSQLPGDHHYSLRYYEDPAFAQEFDRSRFGGLIGEYVSLMQERVLVEFLGDLHGLTALDVGTGTARAAIVLSRLGAQVTAMDYSMEMLRAATTRVDGANLSVAFMAGDASALMFADQAFDVVTSLRMLMHVQDWRQCLGEMCRLSRQRVVFDFPPLPSAAAIQVIARRVATQLGSDTEAYRVISMGAVESVLSTHGFRVVRAHRQFVLPIGLHRLLGWRSFTEKSEAMLGAIGLRRIFGSPVTILAERAVGVPTPRGHA